MSDCSNLHTYLCTVWQHTAHPIVIIKLELELYNEADMEQVCPQACCYSNSVELQESLVTSGPYSIVIRNIKSTLLLNC